MIHGRTWAVPPMLLASLGLLGLAIYFVNPWREVAHADDFAYAWAVRHLVETGKYQVHAWASANPIVQTYWGALFEYVLGAQYGSLRISTLVLAFFGILALYGLAREHDIDPLTAGFITIVLISCPLVLKFSFSFMTDVPFLMWEIIALFLYTRAIRLQSYSWMIVASVAGSAAVLTRQFGMALIGGLVLLWILDGCHRRQLPLLLLGAVLPLIAALWQIHFGARTPTWAMAYSMTIQSQHISDWRKFIGDALWRPAMIVQYLVFFTAPLGLWAIVEVFKELFQKEKTGQGLLARWDIKVLIGFVVYLLLVMSWTRDLMPLLDSNFNELRKLGLPAQALATLFTITGAVAYAWIVIIRFSSNGGWTQLPAQQRLLDLVTLFVFILHLVFAQLLGRYVLCLLPFPLIVIGRYLQKGSYGMRRIAVLTSVLLFIASAMWTRGSLEAEEAIWRASEEVRLEGVNERQIYSSLAWNCRYLLDEYLSDIGYDHGPKRLGDFFIKWLPEIEKTATYLILSEDDYRKADQTGKGVVIARMPYRSTLLRQKWAIVVNRTTPR